MNALEEQIKAAFEPYRFSGAILRPAGTRRPLGPRHGRRWTAGLGIAAAGVTLALLLPAVLPGTGPGGADPAVAAVLSRFSSIALDARAEASLGPDQYVYEETESRTLMAFVSSGTGLSFRYWVPSSDERWLGPDGSGRSRGTLGQPTFLTDDDRAAYDRYVASGVMEQEWGDFGWGGSHDRRFAPGEMTFFDFSDLPTDVDVLKGMLERREIIGGPQGDWETFNLAADTLTWSYAPPELRAALFEVMAGLPGVELIGRVEDDLGRTGIAVGYTHDDQRQEIVLERGTARVLERRWVSVSGETAPPAAEDICSGAEGACGASEMWIAGPPGTVSHVTTYEVYGAVVDDIDEVPQP